MSESVSPAETARVTVVIVNFNGGSHVLRCLDSLAAQTALPERIVLVDNASSDESLAAARAVVAATPAPVARRLAGLPADTGQASLGTFDDIADMIRLFGREVVTAF